jgi:hypothetical protein
MGAEGNLCATDIARCREAHAEVIDGRPHFAKPSIGVGEKVEIAAIDPDFD